MNCYTQISKYRKPLDIITNYFHYPIATYLCVIISKTSIKPNHITLLSIFSELGAVYFIINDLEANKLLIVGLLQLGWIFDLMDGMLARYKKMGFYHPTSPSKKGFYLDAVSDHILKFLILGSLAYRFSLDNENGWILGLISIVIHGITQTEHTLRELINKTSLKNSGHNTINLNIFQQVALLMNNIYLFYLIFIPMNRIDLFFILFAGAELILLSKRIVSFWLNES